MNSRRWLPILSLLFALHLRGATLNIACLGGVNSVMLPFTTTDAYAECGQFDSTLGTLTSGYFNSNLGATSGFVTLRNDGSVPLVASPGGLRIANTEATSSPLFVATQTFLFPIFASGEPIAAGQTAQWQVVPYNAATGNIPLISLPSVQGLPGFRFPVEFAFITTRQSDPSFSVLDFSLFFFTISAPSIHYTYEPVPEPATLLGVSLALLWILRPKPPTPAPPATL